MDRGADPERALHQIEIALHHHRLIAAERQAAIEHAQACGGAHRIDAGGFVQLIAAGGIELHAALFPQRPTDRHRLPATLPGCGQAIAVSRELVHEPVRGRVISLADIADGGGKRGKEDHEIEIEIARGEVQMPGAVDLGRQYATEVLHALLEDEAIGDGTRAVQNAVDLAVLGDDRRDGLVSVRRVVQIQSAVLHPPAACLQRFQQCQFFGGLRDLDRRCAAAQHDGRLTGARQDFACEQRPQAAQTTGDQIDAAILERALAFEHARRILFEELPARREALAACVSDQVVVRMAALGVQQRGQRIGVDIRIHQHDLPGDLRILQARGLHQAGQAGVHRVLFGIGQDQLQQRLALRSAADECLQLFEADLGKTGITVGDGALRIAGQQRAVARDAGGVGLRQATEHDVLFRIGDLRSGIAGALPDLGRDQRAERLLAETARGETADLYADIAFAAEQVDVESCRLVARARPGRVARPHQHLPGAGSHDAQRLHRERHDRIVRDGIPLEQQRRRRLQRAIEQARMQYIVVATGSDGFRQHEHGQQLLIAAINRHDRTMGGAVFQAHAHERGVDVFGRPATLAHRILQGDGIDAFARGFRAEITASLAVDLVVLGVDLEIDPLIDLSGRIARHHRDIDLLLARDGDRLQPDHVAEFEHAGVVVDRRRMLDRRARHFQIRHARQHFLQTRAGFGVMTRAYAVVLEEELLAAEGRAELLFVEVGRIEMEQRVQHRARRRRTGRLDPVALLGEDRGGQRYALRPAVDVQRHPVDFAAGVPACGQLGFRAFAAVASGCVPIEVTLQRSAQPIDTVDDERDAAAHRLAAGLQCVDEIRDLQRLAAFGRDLQEAQQTLGVGLQAGVGLGRKRHDHRRRRGFFASGGFLRRLRCRFLRDRPGGNIFLEDHERIGAADTETVDRGTARALALVPLAQVCVDEERRIFELDPRIGFAVMQGRRDHAMLDRERGLDQADDAGGRFQMTDIRLDRAERAKAFAFALFLERSGQRLDLFGIAHRRAGTVRFDETDGVGGNIRIPERLARAGDLALGAAGGVAHLAFAVVGDGRTLDHRIDVVAIAHRIAEPLDQHQRQAAAEDHAVRAFVEGADAAGLRKDVTVLVVITLRMRHAHAHTARQRHLALARQHAQARLMQRHQRGRASGLHRHARAGEIELVGQIGSEEVLVVAQVRGACGDFLELRAAVDEVGEITGRHAAAAREYADLLRIAAGVTGVFQGLPGALQQQPDLRIHQLGFKRRDLEERGVEHVDIVQRSGGAHIGRIFKIGLARTGRAQFVVGQRADAFLFRAEVVPEFGDAVRAGEFPGHSDDGDVVALDAHASLSLRKTVPLRGETILLAALQAARSRRVP